MPEGPKAKYHHVTVCDKKLFDDDSIRTISITEGVKALIGCPKGKFERGKCQVGTVVQGLRFDKNLFTLKQAKAWKKKNIKTCSLRTSRPLVARASIACRGPKGKPKSKKVFQACRRKYIKEHKKKS